MQNMLEHMPRFALRSNKLTKLIEETGGRTSATDIDGLVHLGSRRCPLEGGGLKLLSFVR